LPSVQTNTHHESWRSVYISAEVRVSKTLTRSDDIQLMAQRKVGGVEVMGSSADGKLQLQLCYSVVEMPADFNANKCLRASLNKLGLLV